MISVLIFHSSVKSRICICDIYHKANPEVKNTSGSWFWGLYHEEVRADNAVQQPRHFFMRRCCYGPLWTVYETVFRFGFDFRSQKLPTYHFLRMRVVIKRCWWRSVLSSWRGLSGWPGRPRRRSRRRGAPRWAWATSRAAWDAPGPCSVRRSPQARWWIRRHTPEWSGW